jgi:hypothetical protein
MSQFKLIFFPIKTNLEILLSLMHTMKEINGVPLKYFAIDNQFDFTSY